MTKESIQDKVNKFINSIWFTVVIGILLYLKTMFFYKETVFIIDEFEKPVITGTIMFIASFIFFLLIMPKKVRTIVTIIADILITVLLFSDNIYFSFSNNIISLEQFSNLQYGEEIMSTLVATVRLKHLFYFIDIIILICLALFLKLEINKQEKTRKYETASKILTGIMRYCYFYRRMFTIYKKRG
ncbi:MAG: hypothetical protein HUJ68_00785 [Clostridia bacterium]|nr:hypothetical protein [Clostridia bacterium]